MPGAEFIYENQRYILSGQLTNESITVLSAVRRIFRQQNSGYEDITEGWSLSAKAGNSSRILNIRAFLQKKRKDSDKVRHGNYIYEQP